MIWMSLLIFQFTTKFTLLWVVSERVTKMLSADSGMKVILTLSLFTTRIQSTLSFMLDWTSIQSSAPVCSKVGFNKYQITNYEEFHLRWSKFNRWRLKDLIIKFWCPSPLSIMPFSNILIGTRLNYFCET